MNRRQFITSLTTLGVALPSATQAALGLNWFFDETKTGEFWLSAVGSSNKQYGIGWAHNQKAEISASQSPSGFRGHGICQNPVKPQQVVMSGRSPGNQSLVLDLAENRITHRFQSKIHQHMQGHACFSQDGQHLFCTESNYKTGEGKISVWETGTFTQVTEYKSHGIGPHELALMPDGKTLVIANGGLKKHPDSGRKVLNLNSMDSSLTYLNSLTGQLISQHRYTEPSASLRHLDVASDGTVAIAVQVQRKGSGHSKLIPLAVLHKPNHGELIPLHAPDKLTHKLKDYMGSVRIHSEHRIAAFTSPRGNLAMFWDLDNHQLKAHHAFHNVCGLTLDADKKHFILSSSAGKIRRLDSKTLIENKDLRLNFPNQHWDNHMLTVSI